jgi:release factor glutamine methyltransferase
MWAKMSQHVLAVFGDAPVGFAIAFLSACAGTPYTPAVVAMTPGPRAAGVAVRNPPSTMVTAMTAAPGDSSRDSPSLGGTVRILARHVILSPLRHADRIRLRWMPGCQSCGQDNPSYARFCLGCGTPLAPPDGMEMRVLRLLVKGEPKTIEELLELGSRILADSSHLFEGHDHAAEARRLLDFSLRRETEQAWAETEVLRKQERERYLSLIARRAGGEPLPLIMGHTMFSGLDLTVRRGEFIPRPSSELTVSRVLNRLRHRRSPTVVDLCTGIGPIALAVAKGLPHGEVYGTDISEHALSQARANARRLGINNVRFAKGDMYQALPRALTGKVDAISGFIPYIPPAEVRDMPSETREFEPLYSLTDMSHDGFGLLRRAILDAPQWLRTDGWLLLEIDEETAPKLLELCRQAGFDDASVGVDGPRLSVVVEARRARYPRQL